eukprot:CAMPEP_0177310452 /NCGR_PEP_ID=MMETSP0368-20130122/9843_1 /TAXON_ID=447022 ORGANISM="Scrippsiella hangoei-like, Strain SHHI-4" /NCGR_SAMPLE_ID=MMETSP0368 /ASSEMBLY_ACC=CAM_ASM_000363 /LENGTH=156 /DNA_ID=CAMNT_0018769405 /DNA_START=252 /DNA_END=722 /DNA_ORIENTATION=+
MRALKMLRAEPLRPRRRAADDIYRAAAVVHDAYAARPTAVGRHCTRYVLRGQHLRADARQQKAVEPAVDGTIAGEDPLLAQLPHGLHQQRNHRLHPPLQTCHGLREGIQRAVCKGAAEPQLPEGLEVEIVDLCQVPELTPPGQGLNLPHALREADW